MAEIISFVALPFDFVDGGIAAGEPVDCPSPAAAIQRAQGLWKLFGHAGSVAFSRTTDFEIGKFNDKHVLCRFGQVTDDYPRHSGGHAVRFGARSLYVGAM